MCQCNLADQVAIIENNCEGFRCSRNLYELYRGTERKHTNVKLTLYVKNYKHQDYWTIYRFYLWCNIHQLLSYSSSLSRHSMVQQSGRHEEAVITKPNSILRNLSRLRNFPSRKTGCIVSKTRLTLLEGKWVLFSIRHMSAPSCKTQWYKIILDFGKAIIQLGKQKEHMSTNSAL